jgi:hypothetical protein
MSSPQLFPNYLTANRKRLALSQDEVAFLLGNEIGEKVCRHERFLQVPELETILAYEVIYQRPIRELFGGLFQKIQTEVAARAKMLSLKKNLCKPNHRSARKQQALADIVAARSASPRNPS